MERISHTKRMDLLLLILDKGRDVILPLILSRAASDENKMPDDKEYEVWKNAMIELKKIKQIIIDSLPEDSRVNTAAFEQSLKENGLSKAYFPLVSVIDDTELALKMMEEYDK